MHGGPGKNTFNILEMVYSGALHEKYAQVVDL